MVNWEIRKIGEFAISYPVPFESLLMPTLSSRMATAFTELFELELADRKYFVSVATSDPGILSLVGVENYKGVSITNSHEHFASFFHLSLSLEGIDTSPENVLFVEFYPDRDDLTQSYDLCFQVLKRRVEREEQIYWIYRTPPRWFHLWRVPSLGMPIDHEGVLKKELPKALMRLKEKGYGRELHPILEDLEIS